MAGHELCSGTLSAALAGGSVDNATRCSGTVGQAPEQPRFVVLRADASLYASRGAADPVIDQHRLAAYHASPFLTRVFRLVAKHDHWIEVENLTALDHRQCQTDVLWPLNDMRLRLFARRQDVAPVLTKPLQQAYDDGTSVALLPGVAVIPMTGRPTSERWVRTGGLEIVVGVDPNLIGESYQIDQPPFAERPSDSGGPWLSGTAFEDKAVHLGPHGIVGPAYTAAGKNEVPHMTETLYDREDRGSMSLVELRSPCIRIRALTPTRYVKEKKEAMLLGTIGLGSSNLFERKRPPQVIQEGSVLYWRGGAHAGEAIEDLDFHDETARDGTRRCVRRTTLNHFNGSNPPEPAAFMELCVAADAISAPADDATAAPANDATAAPAD